MKKCPYCGQEYSDEYSICAIDENPLESGEPALSRPRETSSAFSAMSQHTKAALISGACFIITIAFPSILWVMSGASGGFVVLSLLGCLNVANVILIAAVIAFIVQGFKVHWGWGLATLILGPLAGIVFFIEHRQEGRVPFYILIHGLMLFFIFFTLAFVFRHLS